MNMFIRFTAAAVITVIGTASIAGGLPAMATDAPTVVMHPKQDRIDRCQRKIDAGFDWKLSLTPTHALCIAVPDEDPAPATSKECEVTYGSKRSCSPY